MPRPHRSLNFTHIPLNKMKILFLTILSFIILQLAVEVSVIGGGPPQPVTAASTTTLPVPPGLIALESVEGAKLLDESDARATFLTLVTHFECQENLGYCGPATAACVLNSAGLPRPSSPTLGSYGLFTQSNFFVSEIENVTPASSVREVGLTLEQLRFAFEVHGASAKAVHASDGGIDVFRTASVNALRNGQSFIVVNYLRASIGQQHGGHISPLAAYHDGSDRFLLLDVSKYKYPPVWITAADLWKAMKPIDEASQMPRGYILIQR